MFHPWCTISGSLEGNVARLYFGGPEANNKLEFSRALVVNASQDWIVQLRYSLPSSPLRLFCAAVALLPGAAQTQLPPSRCSRLPLASLRRFPEVPPRSTPPP